MSKIPSVIKSALDPLNHTNRGQRILTDNGISQAIKGGLLSGIDLTDRERLQPATLDMVIGGLRELGTDREPTFADEVYGDSFTFKSKTWYEAYFTETVDYTSYTAKTLEKYLFFRLGADLRSSNIQLGLALAQGGVVLRPNESHTREAVHIYNDTPNDLHYHNDRFAQIYFFVDPFADAYGKFFNSGESLPYDESGEPIRSLDMAVEVQSNDVLKYLRSTGDLVIESKGRFPMRDGQLQFHASSEAYRLKKVDGGINFADRKKQMVWEPFDISDGYEVKPGEHVRVMTQENIRFCSNRVGIRLRDPFMKVRDFYHPDYFDFNSMMVNASAGWFDPGFEMGSGGNAIARYPKIAGRIIKPGDLVSVGQVFYAQNGVGTSYGSAELGSQYQGKERFS